MTIFLPSFCYSYKLKKNQLDSIYQTDHRGFRVTPFDHSNKPQEKIYNIVTMGDSITFGWTNANNFDYSSYLELILNSSFRKIKLPENKQYIDVINAGIPAYTSPLVKNYLRDSILKLNPDMVIISIGHNDIGHSQTPILWFLEKNIPFMHWYYNRSATFSYFRKALSSITSKLKQHSLNMAQENKQNNANFSPDYLAYEKNIREIVRTLKKKQIIPVLMPWPNVPGSFNNPLNFKFHNTKFQNRDYATHYKSYADIMEKISEEFDIPFVKTPFQIPLIPKIHSAKYFMTSGVHMNNYGAKIIGLTLADAIKGILDGKNNKEIFKESFASLEDADLMDLYVYIVFVLESSKEIRKQKAIEKIEHIESLTAKYCVENTKEDMSVPGLHFSECFFAIPDYALYQIWAGKYDIAKEYLDYAIQMYPKFAYHYFIYGFYYDKLGDYENAKLFFDKAIGISPFFRVPRQYLSQLK